MKNIRYRFLFVAALLFAGAMTSCKKDDKEPAQIASVNVLHFAVAAPNVKINASGNANFNYTDYLASLSYGSNSVFTMSSGDGRIVGRATTDLTKDIFNVNESFAPGGLYSLYIVGQSPAIETILRKESYPNYQDSAIAVRVINLSPNSTPVDVTLATSTGVNEFSGIAYKQASDFKKYSAKTGITQTAFNFQIKDAGGTIISTYPFTATNLSASRFKSVTLVLKGLVGGTGANAPGISFIANY